MIAVLVGSTRKGSSGMVAVRRCRRVRVSGLDGDVVRVLAFNGSEIPKVLEFSEDGEHELPPCHSVSAEHADVGRGYVFVDLVR